MMPVCSYRGCKKVAEVAALKVRDMDGFGWETVYLCEKHGKKLMKKLGRIEPSN